MPYTQVWGTFSLIYFADFQRLFESGFILLTYGLSSAERTIPTISSGVNVETVMKWTGHSSYKSMKPYIDVTDEDKARAMRKVFGDQRS